VNRRGAFELPQLFRQHTAHDLDERDQQDRLLTGGRLVADVDVAFGREVEAHLPGRGAVVGWRRERVTVFAQARGHLAITERPAGLRERVPAFVDVGRCGERAFE